MYIKHLLSLTVFMVMSTTGISQDGNTKVIFIIADGISADVIEKVATPNLDAISREGGYTRAYMGGEKEGYSQTPTISAVGYNSLLTGTWANKHNVWGNGIKAPNYKYWTLFRFAQEQRPELKTAIFSTWLDNRTKLIGEGLTETGSHILDYHFDGFELDTINFPHNKERTQFYKIDEHVVAETARQIKTTSPDLSWVYLEYTDDMGHLYGDSEQFYRAVRIMDGQIGKLWTAIQYRQMNYGENWEIYITTDHGRTRDTGKGHGGQSERERLTWIVTNAKDVNPYFKQHQPAIVDIMPSMMRSLGLSAPRAQAMEIDGVPITGPVSVARAKAVRNANGINLTWTAFDHKEKIKIWMCSGDNFAKGNQDAYMLLAEVNAGDGAFEIDLGSNPKPLYKLVLEGKHNMINTWAVLPNKEAE